MKFRKDLRANRRLVQFLCLLLSFSLTATIWGPIGSLAAGQKLHRENWSKESTQPSLPAGAQLGKNLPDLSPLRNSPNRKLAAPEPITNSRPCYDCERTGVTSETLSAARVDPRNRTGKTGIDLLSQNFHWSKQLVNYPGRAKLDLNLELVYNSLVWIKAASQIAFDADRGQPSPGFRLGFPTIQPRYRSAQTGTLAYLLVTAEGGHVELRQTKANVYEAQDNSLLQLIDRGASGAVLRRPDGTQLSFEWINGQLQCTEIKDRNGNYISAGYDARGHLSRVTDTLGRTLLFNRDRGGNLLSITQPREGAEDHVLATFGYSDLTVGTGFSGLKVIGPRNGSQITVLTQMGLPDGSRYQFDYTSWGQVWRITTYAPDGHALAYSSYNLPQDAGSASADCPRPTELHNWAENVNNDAETVTRFEFDGNGGWGQVTLPDGSVHKEVFATSGWQRGLTVRTEDWSGGSLRRKITTDWTQDDTSVDYALNPRPQETRVYDQKGNQKHTRTEYGAYGLPSDIYEYGPDGVTVAQHKHLTYNLAPVYVERHVLGLVSEETVFRADGSLASKTTKDYDLADFLVSQKTGVQHDAAYGSNLLAGRGLLNAVRRWDVTDANDSSRATSTYTGYNLNGSVAFTRDSAGRQANVEYGDNFSDGKNRGTLAYATVRTDPAGNRWATQYDYNTGAVVRNQDADGTVRTNSYDEAGRTIARANETTGAATRIVYGDNGIVVAAFSKKNANSKEIGFYTVYDGMKRVRARAKDPVSSTSGYKGIIITRDALGRAVSRTSPTKMTPTWVVAGPDDAIAGGFPQRPLGLISPGPRVLGAVIFLFQYGSYYDEDPYDGGHYTDPDGDGYWNFVGDYDGAYNADLDAVWNAAGGYWDFCTDQTPVTVSITDISDPGSDPSSSADSAAALAALAALLGAVAGAAGGAEGVEGTVILGGAGGAGGGGGGGGGNTGGDVPGSFGSQDFALGVHEYLSTFRGNANYYGNVDGSGFASFQDAIFNAVDQTVANGGTLRFNLQGVDIDAALDPSVNPDIYNSYTSQELRYVIDNYPNNTVFYDSSGNVISIAEIIGLP